MGHILPQWVGHIMPKWVGQPSWLQGPKVGMVFMLLTLWYLHISLFDFTVYFLLVQGPIPLGPFAVHPEPFFRGGQLDSDRAVGDPYSLHRLRAATKTYGVTRPSQGMHMFFYGIEFLIFANSIILFYSVPSSCTVTKTTGTFCNPSRAIPQPWTVVRH